MTLTYNNGAKQNLREGDVSITDGNSQDNTFSLGEWVTLEGTWQGYGVYQGTMQISGNTYVILTENSLTQLIGPAASLSDFPDTLFINQVSPDLFWGDYVFCFLSGTAIATPAGDTPVDTLAIGDLVLTADGRTAPVRWVGVQTVVTLFADPLRSLPVRIAAGALGEGLPVRDLLVSPDHALFLDGLLVQAGALVNGTTIVRETAMPERFTYFHVELDDHALILAEGVPAETFLDTVTRRRFDNFAEYEARYGDTGPVLAEIPAPRIKSARQLPAALRQRLAVRAIALAAGTAVAA
jgi:hypothetical protein